MQCEALKATGGRCGSRAQNGRRFCYFHDPDQAEGLADARRRGGQAKPSKAAATYPDDHPAFAMGDATEVKDSLAKVFNDVAKGVIPAKLGSTLGYLATCSLRALETHLRIVDQLQILKDIEELKKEAAVRRGDR